jgi:polar amino acid transport system substrate-binding protein
MKTSTSLSLAMALIAVSSAQLSLAQSNPASITLCHENEDSYPWIIKAKPGYSMILMKEIELQLGLPIKLVARPWKECMEDVKSGAVDGAINASYSKERAEFAAFPLKMDGEPDASKRMYRATYALYRQKGGSIDFDGHKINGLTGSIGAQTGFSIIAQLKQLGVKVDDSMTKADDLLKQVASGKLQGAALQTTEADDSLRDTDLKGKIERVSTPLVEKPYYTVFNKAFELKYRPSVREVWRLQGKVRDSAEFKGKVAHLVKAVD